MPLTAIWIDLKIILLSEVSQGKTYLYVKSKKNGTKKVIYRTETDSQTQKTNLWLSKVKEREKRDELEIWD